MRKLFPGLAILAGDGRGDQRFDDAGDEGLGDFRRLDLQRRHAGEFGDAARRIIIGADLHALHFGSRVHFLLEIESLRRPRHRVQHHQPLGIERPGDFTFAGLPQLLRLVIGTGDEGNRIEAEKRILVLVRRQQPLADRGLSRLHGALDVVALEQRAAGMGDDVDLARRGAFHAFAKGLGIDRMKIARGIGHRHVPFLRRGRGRGQVRKRQESSGKSKSRELHVSIPSIEDRSPTQRGPTGIPGIYCLKSFNFFLWRLPLSIYLAALSPALRKSDWPVFFALSISTACGY